MRKEKDDSMVMSLFSHHSDGFVYLIGDDNHLVKIGWSRNPFVRLFQLRTGNPNGQRLAVRAMLPGSCSLERELHFLFRHLRLSGEWFDDTNGVIEEYFEKSASNIGLSMKCLSMTFDEIGWMTPEQLDLGI